MKKFLSFLLTFVMLFTCVFSVTAEAAVCYDSNNPDVKKSNYNMLNITGTNYYKAAFDCLAEMNTARTGNGSAVLPMDSELMEAAMLRARELSVYPDAEYRPNGERFDYIVDFSGTVITYTMTNVSEKLNAKEIADYWISKNEQYIAAPELKAAGMGCFKDCHGYYFWCAFLSVETPINIVKASNYSPTKNSTVKIALRNDLADKWNNYLHTSHSYQVTSTTKADAAKKKNGKIVKKCTVCNKTVTSTIYYPKTISLSATSYTYNGKVKKPSVTVKNSKGNKIGSQYYSVSYSKGRKNVGKYTVTIKFKGNYTGTIKKTFTIKPKSTSISKLTAGKKKFTVKWKKQTSQTTGYQIQYSTNKNFKSAKTVTVSKNKTTSKAVSKLKAKKKYYVRIRTYKTVGKTKIYSSWSKAKTVTTKK